MPRIIELTEFEPTFFPEGDIPYEIGKLLWTRHRQEVELEPPSFQTGFKWKLTQQGWAGHIPLTPDFHLSLRPKVEIGNIFGMLEYAYRLKSFRFLKGLYTCGSMEEFYEQLAGILARRVIDRGRKGFHRSYVQEHDQLPYVRGRLDSHGLVRAPWRVDPICHFEEHTADIEDNRILAWTLYVIARSGLCSERVSPVVRRAFRAVQGLTSLIPVPAAACAGRMYHRLNEDYLPMHALCRFFLAHSGPTLESGERAMLPFLVNMARLYELFVAEWLKQHLPPRLELKAQEKISLGEDTGLRFNLDLTIYNRQTGDAVCIIDTKYKSSPYPSASDIAQVVAYTEAKHCKWALLVYPKPLATSLDIPVGNKQVKGLIFGLEGDLEHAGQRFLNQLMSVTE